MDRKIMRNSTSAFMSLKTYAFKSKKEILQEQLLIPCLNQNCATTGSGFINLHTLETVPPIRRPRKLFLTELSTKELLKELVHGTCRF
jgi:hypothetical protein